MYKSDKKSKNEKLIEEFEREELIRLREENKYLKIQILFKKVSRLATERGRSK